MSSGTAWFVDSSVILRALVNNSTAVQTWFTDCVTRDDEWYGSRMLELEVRRVLRDTGGNQADADVFLDRFHLVTITDDIVDDAIAIPYPLSGADAIHVATAITMRALSFTFVTHDAQQARAVRQENIFEVFDPVTDDPGRPPAA